MYMGLLPSLRYAVLAVFGSEDPKLRRLSGEEGAQSGPCAIVRSASTGACACNCYAASAASARGLISCCRPTGTCAAGIYPFTNNKDLTWYGRERTIAAAVVFVVPVIWIEIDTLSSFLWMWSAMRMGLGHV
mmetsp:Transcript_13006/g.30905  ORF Transcript_13006/g.30905 Transcript_13006/m.30905 type:complete len:132 (+) Transcript_13006:1612-2007(+)